MTGEPECEIEILDLTESIDQKLAAELSELCCFALRREDARTGWTVSIALTDDEHIKRLHDEFMGIAEPTDIITFPDDDQPGGDIVISIDQADRQRHDEAWSLDQELRFLVLHGALHLVGWDDATDELRAAMLDRQRVILAEFQSESFRSW